MNYHKKFEQAVYDRSDARAKQIVMSFLNRYRECVFMPAETYDVVDLVGENEDHEVFMAEKWLSSDNFPFPYVFVLERKGDKAKDRKRPLIFWEVCLDGRAAWRIRGESLTKNRKVMMPNEKMEKEYFYKIPKEECRLYVFATADPPMRESDVEIKKQRDKEKFIEMMDYMTNAKHGTTL